MTQTPSIDQTDRIVYYVAGYNSGDIYTVGADGSNQIRLTDNSATDSVPAWSPDGKHIVFSSDRDGDWDIYMMDTDGSDMTLLTEDPANENNPSWSPNGDKIAFDSDRDGDFEIYVMDTDGTNVIQLTKNR